MLLYERFKDEAEFREKFVKPLLNRLGYYGVSEQHGAQEFGKDFVFSELHRLGGMRHYAAQVKHEERINASSGIIVGRFEAARRPPKEPCGLFHAPNPRPQRGQTLDGARLGASSA
jgi:hypothetical protein